VASTARRAAVIGDCRIGVSQLAARLAEREFRGAQLPRQPVTLERVVAALL